MAKKLYVGNLSFGVTDSDLQQLFEVHGAVRSAQVIMDRETGRSKGFGFVEMDNGDEAQAAIGALNGKEVSGRSLTVNEARPREDRVLRAAPAATAVAGAVRAARAATKWSVSHIMSGLRGAIFWYAKACFRVRKHGTPPKNLDILRETNR